MSSFFKTEFDFKHAFSTRFGGVSQKPFNTLNLGFEYGDNADDVIKNWKIFSDKTNIAIENLVWAKQVHNNDVKIVNAADAGPAGIVEAVGQYDGLVTNNHNISLCIFTADCVPVLLCDKSAGVIAALHCGWKPLTKDIIKNGLNAMFQLGANSKNIQAAIGPGIASCCFETDIDVVEALDSLIFEDARSCYHFEKNINKYHVDLKLAVRLRLLQLGILKDNIKTLDLCTSCNNDKFFSYRADDGKTGRMASIISL